MTKSYDIDLVTELTAAERSEIRMGLDARATTLLRNLTLAEGCQGVDSWAYKNGQEVLGTVVNAYRKVCGTHDAFESWIDSFRESDSLRLRVALRNRPEN
jgi:hypothetical protein